ncbi:MAG: hypothetical protein HRT77_09745 [Halioglobus sp.]|nr:hypothetical protein [Halioglobus sp.]
MTTFGRSERDGDADLFALEEQERIANHPTKSQPDVNLVMLNCRMELLAFEPLARTWEDIDFGQWTAKVQRALVTGPSKFAAGLQKSCTPPEHI